MSERRRDDDRRTNQRFSFYRHTHYSAEGRHQHGLIQDLSIGGMRLLCTNAVARVGGQLMVTLPRSGPRGSAVAVRCEVTWCRSRAIGVRFINPPPALRRQISALLRRSRDSARRGASVSTDRTTIWG